MQLPSIPSLTYDIALILYFGVAPTACITLDVVVALAVVPHVDIFVVAAVALINCLAQVTSCSYSYSLFSSN